MQCPSLTLQVVGKLCYGGKAMNESSASSFYMVLLFILRCFVPLAVLFGISYLLRRMGLVAIEPPEPKEEPVEESTKDSVEVASSPKSKSATQPKKPKKRKPSLPKKKTDTKPKTGTSRSPSK
jgi:outer membrane biosynthesis protein TonB